MKWLQVLLFNTHNSIQHYSAICAVKWFQICVIYRPSTEPSIKRCIWVNKEKNSGSRWVLNNNITRCPDGSSQLETRCRSESQRQTEGFGPSVTHGWAIPANMRKKCCYGREKNLGQYSNLSPSPTHPSHTTNITLSRIKCEILYFYKEVSSFVIEVVIIVDYVSAYICIWMWLYNIWLCNTNNSI